MHQNRTCANRSKPTGNSAAPVDKVLDEANFIQPGYNIIKHCHMVCYVHKLTRDITFIDIRHLDVHLRCGLLHMCSTASVCDRLHDDVYSINNTDFTT